MFTPSSLLEPNSFALPLFFEDLHSFGGVLVIFNSTTCLMCLPGVCLKFFSFANFHLLLQQ